MTAVILDFSAKAREQLGELFDVDGRFIEIRSLFTRFVNEHLPMPKIGQEFEFNLPLVPFSLKAVFVLKESHEAIVIKGEVKEEYGVPVAEVTEISPHLTGEKKAPIAPTRLHAV